jgi:hypothetical protein
MTRGRFRACIALVIVLLACETEVFPPSHEAHRTVVTETPDPKVVVFVIDGPRYSDSFGDSLHAHVDGMWNTLRPQGTLCSNFRNLGTTLTVSGHCALLTGVWQTLNNEGLEHPTNPTLFEYYRKATGAPIEDAVLVGGKPKLNACVYSLDPAYGAAFAGLADTGHATDYATYDRLIQRLSTDHPHLVLASFSQVDQKAHGGVWDEYVNQMEIVDSLAVLTWNYLQSDPEYAGQTTMFITADHGRHDDAHGGFQNHGDACPGCQHVIFLALGPDIRIGYEIATLYTQRDVCTTVGNLLGFSTPQSSGLLMDQIFEPSPTGILR